MTNATSSSGNRCATCAAATADVALPTSAVDLVAAAHAVLLTHRWDATSGACAGCGRPSPCEAANDAAHVVVAAGAWNTLPLQRPEVTWARPAAPSGARPRGAVRVMRRVLAVCAGTWARTARVAGERR